MATQYTFKSYFTPIGNGPSGVCIVDEKVNGDGHLKKLTQARFSLETMAIGISNLFKGELCTQRERTYRKPF